MHTNRTSATIIADSINEFGDRITTFKLVFWRAVLAELNTHRVLTKNSASSRAIPYKKMVSSVWNTPFVPIAWMKEHKGMQGSDYHTGVRITWWLRNLWLLGRTLAIAVSWMLHKSGLSKQFANRMLEPFMWHTVLLTGTEFENFFALRAHNDAEIHIRNLAYKMLEAYNLSMPVSLKAGEWHLPMGDEIDETEMVTAADQIYRAPAYQNWFLKLKITVARNARMSYTVFGAENKVDYKADFKLHDRLLSSTPIHASPSEHSAQCMTADERTNKYYRVENGVVSHGWCRNFRGFKQYRTMLPNDTATDSRVIKKEYSTI